MNTFYISCFDPENGDYDEHEPTLAGVAVLALEVAHEDKPYSDTMLADVCLCLNDPTIDREDPLR